MRITVRAPRVVLHAKSGLLAAAALALSSLLTSCAELEYLRTKSDEQSEMIAALETKLREWQDAYDKLLNQSVRRNQELQSQINTLNQEVGRLRVGRTDNERRLEATVNERTLQLQAEINKNLEAQQQIETLKASVAALNKDLGSLKTSKGQSDKSLADALAQIESLRADLDKSGKALQAAEQRAKAAEKERTQLKSSLADQQRDVEQRDRQIEDFQVKIAELQDNVKLANESRTTISAQVAELKRQLGDERQKAETERQKHQTEISRLTKQLTSLGASPRGADTNLAKVSGQLEKALDAEIRQKSAEVTALGDRLVVRLFSDWLFEPATLILRPSAQGKLREVAATLAKYSGYQLRVEGHTDNVPPVNMPFPDNLSLSGQRAINVLGFLQDIAKLPQKQIRATGCADSQPIATNATAEGRQRNRRVEIILALED